MRELRIRIVSDGTPVGTRFYDAETGEELDLRATRVEIAIGVRDRARARIEILGDELDIVADAVLVERH